MPSDESIDFERVISLLVEAGADVVVIGGVAVSILGSDYLTKDVDFAFQRTKENAKAIVAALRQFHPRPLGFPADLPFVWDEQTLMGMTTMTLETDIGRIDFLSEPDGAPPFATLKARAQTYELRGGRFYVASIDDLISMKRAAGRPKDLAHIAELETIKRLMAEGQ